MSVESERSSSARVPASAFLAPGTGGGARADRLTCAALRRSPVPPPLVVSVPRGGDGVRWFLSVAPGHDGDAADGDAVAAAGGCGGCAGQ